MSRARCIPHLALRLPLWAGVSLAHGGPSPDDSVATYEVDEAGLELRLADGSSLRVPFNATAKRVNGSPEHAASEDPATDTRRKAPSQRARVFDPETPGAIASVRG
ncbi:MAG TPA: hypothetical protein VLJ19_04905 [Variovorax sp.]|nr:hypothetical protein [Variovorax sp.]